MSKLTNYCYLCNWDAPSEYNLRDHLITVHPGKKNVKPYETEYIELPEGYNYKDWIRINND
jgi:hypothetical protein